MSAREPLPQRPRIVRRPVHGVLLLDKPIGLSSNEALQRAKRLYRAEKAGHTGTLDPLATGLLPLCFGAATKFSQAGLTADKRYQATLRLGVTTSTADAEGEVLVRHPVAVSRADVEAACARFTGSIFQLPPMHSALKHEGRALYDYARAGVEVEREARMVTVHRITVIEGEADRWVIDVVCSKGTYIRTLAEDIGAALGCGAHLTGLRRTASGLQDIGQAVTLDRLADMSEPERDAALAPVDALIADWPIVRLATGDAGRFLAGLRRRLALPDLSGVRVYGAQPDVFLGSAEICAGELIPLRLLSPPEVQDRANRLRPDPSSTQTRQQHGLPAAPTDAQLKVST